MKKKIKTILENLVRWELAVNIFGLILSVVVIVIVYSGDLSEDRRNLSLVIVGSGIGLSFGLFAWAFVRKGFTEKAYDKIKKIYDENEEKEIKEDLRIRETLVEMQEMFTFGLFNKALIFLVTIVLFIFSAIGEKVVQDVLIVENNGIYLDINSKEKTNNNLNKFTILNIKHDKSFCNNGKCNKQLVIVHEELKFLLLFFLLLSAPFAILINAVSDLCNGYSSIRKVRVMLNEINVI